MDSLARHDSATHIRTMEPASRPTLVESARELWAYRDLVLILMRRDISVRYKQAVFGFAWAVAQPIALATVFSLFLQPDRRAPDEAIAYPVFALAGLAAWTFFASAVNAGSDSLVASENLISKVYFPRIALPTAAVLSWLPDLGLSTLVLGLVMAIYGEAPAWTVVLLPLLAGVAAIAALGVSLWAAALNVAYRDVRHAIPFLVQFWLFATPGIYTRREFHGFAETLVHLNPVNGVVQLFRWAALGASPPSWTGVVISGATMLLVLLTGVRYFRRVERYFADVI